MKNELPQKLDFLIKKAVIHEIPIVFIDGDKKVSYTLPWIRDQIDIGNLIDAWGNILSANNNHDLVRAWEKIGEICKPVAGFEENQFFQQLRSPDQSGIYCALGKTTSQFPWIEINAIVNRSLVNKKLIPVHACGVIKKDLLFIFGGPSGIGKSTISQLSLARGCKILDEDQIGLKSLGNNMFGANAWGYSLLECDHPIKAVFKISQSKENHLKPIPKAQTAKFLFQQSMEVLGKTNSLEMLNLVFEFSAAMAKSIPGYNLRFAKAPDFWDLINAELGLD